MRALVATVLLLLPVQAAFADCVDLNRQALPNKATLQEATNEYGRGVASHLRETLNDKNSQPPIDAIAEGVASTSKMITAMDKFVVYLRSVKDAGCFGKQADDYSKVITLYETKIADLRKDRATYIQILTVMSKVEDKPRK